MATVYLDQAIRSIQTSTGTAAEFEYAASSCQGWRNTMEDVHLVIPNFEADSSLFAVFDGHNGIEVASFCSKYLPDYIRSNKKYQSGDICDGLKEVGRLIMPAKFTQSFILCLPGIHSAGQLDPLERVHRGAE